MKVSAALPAGVSALFFDTARRRRHLENLLVGLLEGRDYSEVVLPILDYLEPYEPLLSAAGRSELYRFIDRGGEQLALRSDFTPMLARLLAPRLSALELPLRLFYCGDVVRYRPDRPGRQRESHQLGAELLGASGEAAERELLSLFLAALTTCRVPQVKVVIGFAGALDELLLRAEGSPAALADAVTRRQRREARAGGPALLQVVEDGRPKHGADLGEHGRAGLARLDQLRSEMAELFPDIVLEIDLAEFAHHTRHEAIREPGRQASYYDGLMFRAYSAGGALHLGRGGRYDQMFERLGASVPAVGFSLFLDRISVATEGVG